MSRKSRFFSINAAVIFLVVLINCSNAANNMPLISSSSTAPIVGLLLLSSNDANNIPLISTDIVTSITQISAVSGGEITSDGDASVTARGVCWNTSQNPTIGDSLTSDGGGTGKFTSLLTGLIANTKYYVRAYATNEAGTAYGNQQIFTSDPSIVTDIDGNIYNVVQIGTQLWMQENLKVTKYLDGTAIPNVIDTMEWINVRTGAYCNFNNDVNIMVFGRFYNYYAVVDSRNLCPAGWHVPTDNEWKTLEMFLGMSQAQADITNNWRGTDEGGKLKGTTWWNSPNTGATNNSGFTALPGGNRNDSGLFQHGVIYGDWWSATENGVYTAWFRRLSHNRSTIYRSDLYKNYGYSVRCVKD